MAAEQIKLIIILILGFSFLINLITTLLSSKKASQPLPKELNDIYTESSYLESIRYILTNANFAIIASSVNFIILIMFIFNDGFALLDFFLNASNLYPALIPLYFFGILYFASDIINLPLELYAQFGIEEKFGFNKMTLPLFITDKLKSYLLTIVFGGGILYILFYLLHTFGPNYWIYFWVIISVVMLLLNMFYASIFVPFFNKLTPLEDGELKNAIESYSKKVDFPVDNIFVIDGSKRSTKANAFFSGFGKKKKIVLYDTLIEDLTNDEIVSVLAHEAGHFKKKHIIYSLLAGVVQLGIILYLSSFIIFNEQLSLALGVGKLSLYVNLFVFSILLTPFSMVASILMSIFSRKNEYEADAFAKQTFGSEPLISALKKLSKNNLSNLNPHWLDVFLNYSHPTLLQRIKAMDYK